VVCAGAGHLVRMDRHDDVNAELDRLREPPRHRAEQG
jgi:hypothetical protein